MQKHPDSAISARLIRACSRYGDHSVRAIVSRAMAHHLGNARLRHRQ